MNPYDRTKVYVAYGYGLTGTGVKVGVVDSGFNLVDGKPVHDEFTASGKITLLTSTGALQSDAHGANVSALAVGDKNDKGMQGVAYGASLYLGMSPTSATGFTALFNEYTASGVMVSSNSYGLPVAGDDSSLWKPVKTSNSGFEVTATNALAYRDANSLTSAQMMANVSGAGTADEWTAAVSAIKAYQDKGGVVVWANSNYGPNEISSGGKGLDNADLGAALPLAFPELAGAWVTVVNATSKGLAVQENGQAWVSSAKAFENNIYLNSAPCGAAANFCLSMDGVAMWSASNTGVSSYEAQTGTSQATPMVAGMLALLREAFPTASAKDLVARLLFTADNSFFTNNTTVSTVTTAIYTNELGTITHKVSDIWGHGFADMQAALLPVGTTTTATAAGRSIQPSSLRTTMSVGAAFGTSGSTLNGATYLFNDQLNGVFTTSLSGTTIAQTDRRFVTMAGNQTLQDSVSAAETRSGLRFMMAQAVVPNESGTSARLGRVFALSQDIAGAARLGFGVGLSPDTQLGFVPRHALLRSASLTDNAMGLPLLALGGVNKQWLSAGFHAGGVRTTVAMFNSRPSRFDPGYQAGRDRTTGMVADTVIEGMGPFSLNLSVGRTIEQGGLLGTRSQSTSFGIGGRSDFVRAGLIGRLTHKLGFQANYMLARSVVSSQQEGLIANGSRLRSNAFAFALTADDFIAHNSRLSASLAQPLRVGGSRATLTLPTGVVIEEPGVWHYSYGGRTVDLAPSGRELDYSIEYSKGIGSKTSLSFAGTAMQQPGHDASAAMGFGAMLRLRTAF